ncbi:hypothetical protein KEM54_000690 [Ascosphaera aggregata]|nr:hypothetical protein KEM54_000690 [Ascosphaera aggregata]
MYHARRLYGKGVLTTENDDRAYHDQEQRTRLDEGQQPFLILSTKSVVKLPIQTWQWHSVMLRVLVEYSLKGLSGGRAKDFVEVGLNNGHCHDENQAEQSKP